MVLVPHLGYLVEFAEELVEHVHQFSRRAVTGQAREPDDVCVQNAAENVKRPLRLCRREWGNLWIKVSLLYTVPTEAQHPNLGFFFNGQY